MLRASFLRSLHLHLGNKVVTQRPLHVGALEHPAHIVIPIPAPKGVYNTWTHVLVAGDAVLILPENRLVCCVRSRQAPEPWDKGRATAHLPLPRLDSTSSFPTFLLAIEDSTDQAQPILRPSPCSRHCHLTNLLDYAINHIFLPPRLPNASDHSPHLEAGLIALVREFAGDFASPRTLDLLTG
jgi:hypothetical protein